MILLAGTIPIKDFPLTLGEGWLENDQLIVNDRSFPCFMGSGAMMSAAMVTMDYYGLPRPHLLIAGDIGDTTGSRSLYAKMIELLDQQQYNQITMHYLQPIVTLMDKVCSKLETLENRPFMIADAGSMYAAKAAKRATSFNLFTPDAAEMKFVSDKEAMHPAYVSNYFMQTGNDDVPQLIARAHNDGNAPKYLIVKGKTDYVAMNGTVIHTTTEPNVPLLEPVGGTGDTITGIVSGLIAANIPVEQACHMATILNRTAGEQINVQPDTRVYELITAIPSALKALAK